MMKMTRMPSIVKRINVMVTKSFALQSMLDSVGVRRLYMMLPNKASFGLIRLAQHKVRQAIALPALNLEAFM